MRPSSLICLGLCALLAACSGNNNANNTMNVDENVATVDMNAATDMNAAEANAVENATEVNADTNMTAAPPPPPPPPPTAEATPPAAADGAEKNVTNASTASTNVAVTNAAASVEQGVGAFVKPPEMQVDKWYVLEFLVAPKVGTPGEQTPGTLPGEAQGKPTTAPTTVFISPQMRVTLATDPDMTIQPKTSDVQPTGFDKSATWQWSVKPLTAGNHELSAVVQPLDASGKVLQTYTRYVTIHAHATFGQRVKSGTETATSIGNILAKLLHSWEGAVLALAALIGAIYFLVRTIRNRGSAGPPPGAS